MEITPHPRMEKGIIDELDTAIKNHQAARKFSRLAIMYSSQGNEHLAGQFVDESVRLNSNIQTSDPAVENNEHTL